MDAEGGDRRYKWQKLIHRNDDLHSKDDASIRQTLCIVLLPTPMR
jgi:hypothetical protein